ncbi:hypothetical protein OSH11_03040 [Kaistia dalseonensis]|uniref:Secreted protein n=1 Tax=Kaistia dalseonensis TaxID=410840 RepID=A0ABU0H1Q6_9HYPH|nr:hypothetical protein [Kaistia dalseonensis]MCX5493674.1 hypothetical protein [Kaistia dalseonensis]MDQ0436236.1 hypothetical protein [Kaistia dalseonensis]
MRRAIAALFVLAGLTTGAIAQPDVTPVNPAPYRKLNCDQIAARIQALNVKIGSANNSWDNFKRSPTIWFVLFAIPTPNPEYDQMLAHARGERQALIKLAVDKRCAAKRLVH